MEKSKREYYKQKTIDLYTSTALSMNKIAKELKISDSTVKRFLDEASIDKKRITNYTVKENLFSSIETEEDAYWLGLLYADGNVSSKGNNIELDLKEEDRYLVEQFRQYCKVTKPLKKHIVRRNDKEYVSYRCSFADKIAHLNLIKLGCIPAKSLILKCPNEKQVSDNLLPSFIRGYCDGDGYVRWEDIRHKEFILLGTEDFLNGLVSRMGWKDFAYIHSDGKSKNFKLEVWRMYDVYNILSLLYKNKNLCLKRKQKVFYKAQEYMEKRSQ